MAEALDDAAFLRSEARPRGGHGVWRDHPGNDPLIEMGCGNSARELRHLSTVHAFT
jgi:hypothetical protein